MRARPREDDIESPSMQDKLVGWWRAKVMGPLGTMLAEGASPDIVAVSISLGFNLGLCPIMGISTGICLLFAWLLGPKKIHGTEIFLLCVHSGPSRS